MMRSKEKVLVVYIKTSSHLVKTDSFHSPIPFLSTFFSLFNELAALHMLVDDSCQVCNQARKQNHIRDFNSAN